MEDYQQRVVDEHSELSSKRMKLGTFIQSSPIFERMTLPEQVLLVRQHSAMINYEGILDERIALFPKDVVKTEPAVIEKPAKAEEPAAETVPEPVPTEESVKTEEPAPAIEEPAKSEEQVPGEDQNKIEENENHS